MVQWSYISEYSAIEVEKLVWIALEVKLMKTIGISGKIGWAFLGWIAVLIILVAFGVYAYTIQWTRGLIVTGMGDIVVWGLYVSNFIFFIGLAAGGVVVYASVYLLGAEKFKPLSKVAISLAAVSTLLGMLIILPDLGRPERFFLNILMSPNPSSMLVLDFVVLSAYFLICLIDLILVIRGASIRTMIAMSAVSLPFAIGIHSVTAWIFGVVKARAFWNTGILAPVFLSSAIISSISLLIIVTILTTRFAGFEFPKDLAPELGKILGAVIPVDLFLLGVEILTVGYSAAPEHITPLMFLLAGPYSVAFYAELLFGIAAFIMLVHPAARKSTKVLAVSSVLVMFAIWLKRSNLLLPGLVVSPLGVIGTYNPTWVEWSITTGVIAFGALLYTLAIKVLHLGPMAAVGHVESKWDKMDMDGVSEKPAGGKDVSKPSVPRRQFLEMAVGATVGVAALASIPSSSIQFPKQEAYAQASTVKDWAMVVDLRRCIGCQACFAACKSENGVPLGIEYTWVETHEQGKYPNTRLTFLPRLCNHCHHPPCVQVCPVFATYKREDGVVMQDVNKCIGCRYCMGACPYGVRSFIWQEPRGAWPEMWKGKAEATQGFVVKCHGCYHRIEKGLKPACAEACVGGARIWGDLRDPNSEVRKIVDTLPTQTLKSYLGARPMVFYIGLSDKIAERGKKSAGTIILHEEEIE